MGKTFDEWIEGESLENIKIEDDFLFLFQLDFIDNPDKVFNNWEIIRKKAIEILNNIGWAEADEPFSSCEEILREYDIHDQGTGWGI